MFAICGCIEEDITPTSATLVSDSNNETNLASINMDANSQSSEYFDWENNYEITLGNGNQVTLPWYNGAVTNIPNYILDDYKKEDGWELLYNFCTSSVDTGKNYLIFYNIFTGVIRSYYYLDDQVTSGNEGIWSVDLTNNNALLNNVGYFAKPINQPRNLPVATSTSISTDAISKAIVRGWNCFDTEITYDPNANSKAIKMSIRPYDNNISNITLQGSYNSKSEGTIVTSSSKNPVQDLVNKGAKAAGKEAGDWVKDNVGLQDDANKIIKLGASLLPTIASGGTTALIKAGINLVFGSFIGRFDKPNNTTQKLEFKTNGTVQLDGTLSSTSATNALSVANLYFPQTIITNDHIFPHYDKSLGVWNIDQTPIVKVSRKARLTGNYNGMYYYSRNVQLDVSSFNVVFNNDILSKISKYEVTQSLMLYNKFQGTSNWSGTAVGWQTTSLNNLVYKDELNEFYKVAFGERYESTAPPTEPPCYPNCPNDQITEMPYVWMNGFDNRYVVKVSVKIYPKAPYSTQPIVISRSYQPNYLLVDTEPAPTLPTFP